MVKASGLSISYITKPESGYVRSPQWATIQRLATVLGVSPEALLGRAPAGPRILGPAELRAVVRRLRQAADVLLEMAQRLEALDQTSQEYLRRLLVDLAAALAAYGDRPIQAQDLLAILQTEIQEMIGGGSERDPAGAADRLRPAGGH